MNTTEIPDLRIELAPAAEAIERIGRRLAELLSDVQAGGEKVPGLGWTVDELGAHLGARTGRYAAYLSGSAAPQGEIADIASENQRDVDERRDRPLADHVDELRSNVESFVATTRGKLGSDPFPWYSGVMLDVSIGSGLLLGELVVHGFDAARALDRRWAIGAEDARTVIRAVAVLAPRYVDPQATRGDRTTYRVRVRGGPVFRLRIQDGAGSIEAEDGTADCTVRADPVALVLVSYGRISKWRAALRGKLLATGRRPWRALRFDRSFLPP